MNGMQTHFFRVRFSAWMCLVLIFAGLFFPAHGSAHDFLDGKITVDQRPNVFSAVYGTGSVIQDFMVQNKSDKPILVTFRGAYHLNLYSGFNDRTVTLSRMIPPGSTQLLTLHVPVAAGLNCGSLEGGITLFLNGKAQKLDGTALGGVGSFYSTVESEDSSRFFSQSLDANEYALFFMGGGPSGSSGNHAVVASSDWSSHLQQYAFADKFLHASEDVFSPEMERILRDCVRLGATRFIFVSEKGEWPAAYPKNRTGAIGEYALYVQGFGRVYVLPELNPSQRKKMAEAAESYNGHTEKTLPAGTDSEGNPEEKQISSYAEFLMRAGNNPSSFRSTIFRMLPQQEAQSIPLVGICWTMLVFVLLIGPVNYLFCKRKKKLMLILLTTPLISLIFIVVIILYVTLGEGWYSRGELLGVTFLDQEEGRASTLAGASFYAPIPPGRFSFETEDVVTFSGCGSFALTLEDGQHYDGLVLSRVPMAYALERSEQRREQFKVFRQDDGTLSVVNGLGAQVRLLALADADGALWRAEEPLIPAGASVSLQRTGEKIPVERDLKSGDDLATRRFYSAVGKLGRNRIFLNDEDEAMTSYIYRRRYGRRHYSFPYPTSGIEKLNTDEFHPRNYIQRALEDARVSDEVPLYLTPNTYLVEAAEPLFYKPGRIPHKYKARHLVYGSFIPMEVPQS